MMASQAKRTLAHAFDHLRPRMVADTQHGIPPNGEALAGSILARAMCDIVMERGRLSVPEQHRRRIARQNAAMPTAVRNVLNSAR